jgi:hypothetical protein
MTTTDDINELTLIVADGYNAKKANLLTNPVFVVTYAKGHTIDWDGATKRVPDQITASTATHYNSVSQTLLLENKEDYDREFSAAIGAEYAGVTYSGSVNSSLLYHDTLFQSTSKFYTLNFDIITLLDFHRDAFQTSGLTEEFKRSVEALPATIDGENLKKYFDFFDAYGTHYFEAGHLGGTIVMETSIQDTLLNSSTQIEIKAAITAGYESIAANGKLDIDLAYEGSAFLEKHRNEINISLHVIGGLYSADEKISKWQNSVYTTPSAMLSVPGGNKLGDLYCHSRLAKMLGHDAIADRIVEALREYMLEDEIRDGVLGRTQPLDFNKVYGRDELSGDGFAISLIHAVGEGDRGTLGGQCNSDSNPTVYRGKASQHYYPLKNHHIPNASITMPAPAADSFVMTEGASSGNPSRQAWYIGLGSVDDAVLGDWQDVPFGQTYTPGSDGFIAAWIESAQNGARGEIHCAQVAGQQRTLLAASSMHEWGGDDIHVPCNSFCLPVRKGDTYDMVLYNSDGLALNAKAYFLPMSDSLRFFKPYDQRQGNLTYHATDSDGFLVACIGVAGDGDRAFVTLHSHPDEQMLDSRGGLASTSMNFYPLANTYVPFNTAMIPVAKGNSYKAQFVITSGNPHLYLNWIPLGRDQI